VTSPSEVSELDGCTLRGCGPEEVGGLYKVRGVAPF